MAAALSAVRRKNKKQSYCLGEPEVTLSERVPVAADCIKIGEVDRLTHRWYANCLDSVCDQSDLTADKDHVGPVLAASLGVSGPLVSCR